MNLRLLGVMGALALLPSAASAATCNGTPKRGCLLPFPSNVAHTKKDKASATGRRVAFTRAEMPANAQGRTPTIGCTTCHRGLQRPGTALMP